MVLFVIWFLFTTFFSFTVVLSLSVRLSVGRVPVIGAASTSSSSSALSFVVVAEFAVVPAATSLSSEPRAQTRTVLRSAQLLEARRDDGVCFSGFCVLFWLCVIWLLSRWFLVHSLVSECKMCRCCAVIMCECNTCRLMIFNSIWFETFESFDVLCMASLFGCTELRSIGECHCQVFITLKFR